MIYFIRPEHSAGPIKIGHTAKTTAVPRLACLQAGSPVPLEVIATCAGDLLLERRFHAAFAAYRMHGEWFRPSEGLLLVLEMIREGSFDFDMLPGPAPARPRLRPVARGSVHEAKRETRDALERRLCADPGFRARALAHPSFGKDVARFMAGRDGKISIGRACSLTRELERAG